MIKTNIDQNERDHYLSTNQIRSQKILPGD